MAYKIVITAETTGVKIKKPAQTRCLNADLFTFLSAVCEVWSIIHSAAKVSLKMQIILLKPVQVWVSHEMQDKTSRRDFTVNEGISKNTLSPLGPNAQHIFSLLFKCDVCFHYMTDCWHYLWIIGDNTAVKWWQYRKEGVLYHGLIHQLLPASSLSFHICPLLIRAFSNLNGWVRKDTIFYIILTTIWHHLCLVWKWTEWVFFKYMNKSEG